MPFSSPKRCYLPTLLIYKNIEINEASIVLIARGLKNFAEGFLELQMDISPVKILKNTILIASWFYLPSNFIQTQNAINIKVHRVRLVQFNQSTGSISLIWSSQSNRSNHWPICSTELIPKSILLILVYVRVTAEERVRGIRKVLKRDKGGW